MTQSSEFFFWMAIFKTDTRHKATRHRVTMAHALARQLLEYRGKYLDDWVKHYGSEEDQVRSNNLKKYTFLRDVELLPDHKYNTNLRGNFYVMGGINIINPIVELMDASTNVFLSIDAHPPGHHSFGRYALYNFPPHCVDGTVGQCIVRKIYDKAKEKKAKFFFKACDKHVESFGAVKYQECEGNRLLKDHPICTNKDYHGQTVCRARSLMLNCNEMDSGEILDATGSFLAKDGTFEGLYRRGIGERMKDTKRFLDYLQDNSHITDVYVCGLAGDWCVLDTCVNLARSTKSNHAFRNVKVHFLVDYTKFSILPGSVIESLQRKERFMQFLDPKTGFFYLNHPLLTFGLLQQFGVNVVVGGSKDTRDETYYQAGMLSSRDDTNLTLEGLKVQLSMSSSALFVIDMQNDFALPSVNPLFHGRDHDIVYDRNWGGEFVRGLVQDFEDMKAPMDGAPGWGRVTPE